MATIDIQNLVKTYGDFRAVDDLSLSVAEGEFLVLLGPSGCGKTTTLKMLAGFIEATSGRIDIGGRNVTQMPPHERNLGVVFQNYALFPHLSVFENVAFPLRRRKVAAAEIARQVKASLGLVQMEHLSARLPRELSGGQQQRVAIARALSFRPDVLLLDEPLSNLDAKLRVEMRTEIKRLHQDLGASMVYVTHDQIEAMTLATKIVVMKGGIIQQIGTPAEIYTRPANVFVADFMGSPAMNLIPARAKAGRIEIDRAGEPPLVLHDPRATVSGDILLGLRPEDITEAGTRTGDHVQTAEARVDVVEPAGADTYVVAQLGGKAVTARLAADTRARPGQPLSFGFDLAKVSYFRPDTGERLN